MAKRAHGASVEILHDNGERSIRFVVTIDAAYPDAVDEARIQAVKLYREGLLTDHILDSTETTDDDA